MTYSTTTRRTERSYLNDDLLEREERMSVFFKVSCKQYLMSFLSMLSNRLRAREGAREEEGARAMLSELDKPKKDRQTDCVCLC